MKPLCLRWRQMMLAGLDNELAAGDRNRLESHLAVCDGCRAQYRQLQRARSATAALRRDRAEAPVPDMLAESIMRNIRQEIPQPATYRSRRRETARRYATALATVILAVALALVYRSVSLSLMTQNALTTSAALPTATISRQQAQEKELGSDTNRPVTDASTIPAPAAVSGSYNAGAAEANGTAGRNSGLPGNDIRTGGAATPPVDSAKNSTGTMAGSGSTAMGPAAAGYRLYTGNLTDLGTLVGTVPDFRLPPQLLADAANLRILVSPADAALPVRQVAVLAGYPAADAVRVAEQFRSALPAGSNRVTVETIVPESQSRLAAIFGDALYASLLPTPGERQLTYIMITIGG